MTIDAHRLAEGLSLGNLTEAPLAVRFLFVMIGPKKSTVDYFEVGRSISTLLSNSVRDVHTTNVSCVHNSDRP